MMATEWARQAAQEAYEELTVAQKKVWNLCKRQGLSKERAGARLCISKEAVQQRLICAQKKFKKHLELIKDKIDGDSNDL